MNSRSWISKSLLIGTTLIFAGVTIRPAEAGLTLVGGDPGAGASRALAAPVTAEIPPGTVIKYILDGLNVAGSLASIFSFINLSPPAGLSPPIALVVTETAENITFQVSGGNITSTTSETVVFTGKYWTGTFAITQSAGVIYDEVDTSGNFTHILGPHTGDGTGGTMQFTMSINGFFPPPFNPSKSVVLKPNPSVHPNGHLDDWSGDITANITILSDITTWSAFIQGNHVPEPSTLVLSGSASIIGLAYAGWRRRAA